MKRLRTKLTFLFSLFVLFLCMASAAQAYEVVFTGTDTVGVRNGYYAGLYSITLDGSPLSVMCDDVTSEIVTGQKWDADVWGYDQLSEGLGKFESDRLKYSQAAFLFKQTFGETNASVLADLNLAIWKVMSPDAGLTLTATAAKFYNEATTTVDAEFDWSGIMRVITPVEWEDGQEFLTAAPVPEPATMLLLGSGLIGLAGISRKKLLKKS